MRIFLFNLGSIASRIKAWGTEGFRSIFEQDVILWGPIPDEKFVFDNKEIHLIRIFEETSVISIFKRFPDNWYPDIVVCDTSVLNFVPDIYLCPVKTVLFTRDAWADTIYNRGLVEFFDFINHGIVDRSLYNRFNVNMLPLSNCAVTLPQSGSEPLKFEKRNIDVISIANYDSGFYHERYKILYELSAANRTRLNIKYVTGIQRKEINKYYQRSKIVLDWAHTLSNRSFEAALNGCLLFSHEANPVIKEFWEPWEEYVPYNESNLMGLIRFYLDNPDSAKKITGNAYGKVKNIPSSMGQSYWEQIKIAFNTEVNISERIKRNELMPVSELNYRLATPLVYNYNYNTNFPVNWKELYFKRIDASIAGSEVPDSMILPLIEAARSAFLMNESVFSEHYLSELEKILPDYAWIWYLRARQYFNQGRIDLAMTSAKKAIHCGEESPGLLQKYVLPLNGKNNSCDGRRITDYLWQPVYRHDNELQVKSLFHLSWELVGDIFFKKGATDDALKAYSEAVSYIAVPDIFDKLFRLSTGSGNFEPTTKIFLKGLEDCPYYSSLVFYSAYALLQSGQKQTAMQLLMEHRNALNSFVGKRRITLIRRSITGILLLTPLGSKNISKAILYILKLLNREVHTDQL